MRHKKEIRNSNKPNIHRDWKTNWISKTVVCGLVIDVLDRREVKLEVCTLTMENQILGSAEQRNLGMRKYANELMLSCAFNQMKCITMGNVPENSCN